jgi:hypothetical protein
MSKIYISYRRADRAAAIRLREALLSRFGIQSIWMDVGDVATGKSIESFPKAAIEASDAVLILIGSGWLSGHVTRDDWTILEIRYALEAKKRIFPILLSGRSFPREDDLPEEIRDLCRFNALVVQEDTDFELVGNAVEGVVQGVAVQTANEKKVLLSFAAPTLRLLLDGCMIAYEPRSVRITYTWISTAFPLGEIFEGISMLR